jgi:hypothetical protein
VTVGTVLSMAVAAATAVVRTTGGFFRAFLVHRLVCNRDFAWLTGSQRMKQSKAYRNGPGTSVSPSQNHPRRKMPRLIARAYESPRIRNTVNSAASATRR